MNSLESFAKFVPAANNVTLNPMGSVILTDMEAKARRFVTSLNDVLYETSNEPSLGFYRIQEHVRKSIPNMLEKKSDLDNACNQIKGTSIDLDYSIDVVSKMANTEQTLENVKTLLTDSLYAARQLNIRKANEATAAAAAAAASSSSPKQVQKS